jgi:hypothetical protein
MSKHRKEPIYLRLWRRWLRWLDNPFGGPLPGDRDEGTTAK